MKDYPTLPEIKSLLRNNLVKPLRIKVLEAFIIGSEAKGTSTEKSDLDIAVVIPVMKRKTSIQFSEIYHSHFKFENQKPKWKDKRIDFQFYYETDKDLQDIQKIAV